MSRSISSPLITKLASHSIASQDFITVTIPGEITSDTGSNLVGQQDILVGMSDVLPGEELPSVMTSVDIAPILASTSQLTSLDARVFPADLRRVAELRQSLGSRSDRTEFDIQNIDTQIGKLICDEDIILDGAQIVYTKVFFYSGTQEEIVMLIGVISQSDVNEDVVTLEVITDVSPGNLTISNRPLARLCQFIFKDPDTCGYVGPGDVCTLVRDDATGGCAFYNNRHRFGGVVFLTAPTASGIIGIGGGGGPFGGGGPGDGGGTGGGGGILKDPRYNEMLGF